MLWVEEAEPVLLRDSLLEGAREGEEERVGRGEAPEGVGVVVAVTSVIECVGKEEKVLTLGLIETVEEREAGTTGVGVLEIDKGVLERLVCTEGDVLVE